MHPIPENGFMKKLTPLGMLVFLLCCNNTDSTIKENEVDNTKMVDTAVIPPSVKDSAQIPLDSPFQKID